jgi:hypothetical protein
MHADFVYWAKMLILSINEVSEEKNERSETCFCSFFERVFEFLIIFFRLFLKKVY